MWCIFPGENIHSCGVDNWRWPFLSHWLLRRRGISGQKKIMTKKEGKLLGKKVGKADAILSWPTIITSCVCSVLCVRLHRQMFSSLTSSRRVGYLTLWRLFSFGNTFSCYSNILLSRLERISFFCINVTAAIHFSLLFKRQKSNVFVKWLGVNIISRKADLIPPHRLKRKELKELR